MGRLLEGAIVIGVAGFLVVAIGSQLLAPSSSAQTPADLPPTRSLETARDAPSVSTARNATSRPTAGDAPSLQPAPVRPSSSPVLAASPKGQVVSEADLNRQLSEALARNADQFPLEHVQAKLRSDGRVDVRGTAELAGRQVEVQATLKLIVNEGKLDIEIVGAKAGIVPLPAAVIDQLVAQATSAAGLTGLKGIQLPPDVEAIEIRDGALIITRR